MKPELLVLALTVAASAVLSPMWRGRGRYVAGSASGVCLAVLWIVYVGARWPTGLIASALLFLAAAAQTRTPWPTAVRIVVVGASAITLFSSVLVLAHVNREPQSETISAGPPGRSDESGVASGGVAAAVSCSQGDQERCLIDWFSTLAKESTPADAYHKLIDALFDDRSGLVMLHCHNVSHELGRLALTSVEGRVRDALGASDPHSTQCSFGFLHGVWQEYFQRETFNSLRDGRNTVCRSVVSDPFAHNSCYHVFGHRLVQERRDTPLDAAKVCLSVVAVHDSVGSCLSGVWMEFFIDTEALQGVDRLYVEDPVLSFQHAGHPCELIDVDEALSSRYCWHEASIHIYRSVGKDPGLALEVCDRADGDAVEWCVLGIGKAIALYAGHALEGVLELCRETDSFNSCVAAAASADAANTGSLERPQQICSHVTDPKGCLDTARRWGNVDAIAAERNRIG